MFKLGDVIQVVNGSWSYGIRNGEKYMPLGLALETSRRWRVVSPLGIFPMRDQPTYCPTEQQYNDLMIVDVNDPNDHMFTQTRFCRLIQAKVCEIKTPLSTGLKVGDIVRVIDSSWATGFKNGEVVIYPNIATTWKVSAVNGRFPISVRPLSCPVQNYNDILLTNLEHPNYIMFSQAKFCKLHDPTNL